MTFKLDTGAEVTAIAGLAYKTSGNITAATCYLDYSQCS